MRYVCLFPLAGSIHLNKDVGMIPFIIGKMMNKKAFLACFRRNQFDDSLSQYHDSLEISDIPDDPKYNLGDTPSLKVIWFIIKSSRKIDILQIFHFTKESALVSILYKTINPRGYLYVKMDAGDHWIKQWRENKASPLAASGIWFKIYSLVFCKFPNLITVESAACHAEVSKLFTNIQSKLKILPNGIDFHWMQQNGFNKIDFSIKENLIITVGRIGSHQKNNEMLLDAMAGIENTNGWKIALIGPIAEKFNKEIEAFFQTYPHHRSSLLIIGEIHDKKALYAWYSKAKYFLLTSRWEGFSLAMVDSLYFGCHIISTPSSAAIQVTNNWKNGTEITSAADLSDKLRMIFALKTSYPEASFNEIRDYARNYKWEKLVKELMNWMKIT